MTETAKRGRERGRAWKREEDDKAGLLPSSSSVSFSPHQRQQSVSPPTQTTTLHTTSHRQQRQTAVSSVFPLTVPSSSKPPIHKYTYKTYIPYPFPLHSHSLTHSYTQYTHTLLVKKKCFASVPPPLCPLPPLPTVPFPSAPSCFSSGGCVVAALSSLPQPPLPEKSRPRWATTVRCVRRPKLSRSTYSTTVRQRRPSSAHSSQITNTPWVDLPSFPPPLKCASFLRPPWTPR